MIWVAALATAIGLGAVWMAVAPVRRAPPQLTALEDRMSFYGNPREVPREDDIDLLSFRERIIQPLLDQLTQRVARLTPGRLVEGAGSELAAAGNPYGLNVSSFVTLRLLFCVLGVALGVAIGVFAGSVLIGVLGAVIGGLAAWFGLGYWLTSEVRARQRRTLSALPDVVDFLVVAVDAGLNFDLALRRVVEKFHNPLTDGIALALSEVQLGRYRLDALEDFARRSNVPEVAAFIQTVVTSERMGVSIALTLRIQSTDLRWRRGEWARERASRAAVRMTFPMVLLIFPTLWLVLLGPSFLALLSRGL
ncbi:MAG TPA: type II secretion system F family protein [Candidatus Dormibacteraeota bacterium]|nr:type II secretion system F family protein [Candidatus Dormibacteraeota bacterium]